MPRSVACVAAQPKPWNPTFNVVQYQGTVPTQHPTGTENAWFESPNLDYVACRPFQTNRLLCI